MSPMPENAAFDLDKWLAANGLEPPASDELAKDALESHVLTWAEAAAALDGLTLMKLEAKLSHLGCRSTFVRRWSTEVKRLQKEARKTAAAKRLDGYNPYKIEDGYLVYYSELGERRVVADFVPQVVEQTLDERGHRTYVIEADTVDGRTFRLEISAQTLADNQALLAAFCEADGAITIFPGQEPRLRAAITQFRVNGAPEIKLYNRTGWSAPFDPPAPNAEETTHPSTAPLRGSAQDANSRRSGALTTEHSDRSAEASKHPERSAAVSEHPERIAAVSEHPERSAAVSEHPERSAAVSEHPERSAAVSEHPERSAVNTEHPERSAAGAKHPERSAVNTEHPERSAAESKDAALPTAPFFLIPGLEPPGVRLELPPQLPFALPATADLTLGLDALDGLLQAFAPELTTIPLGLLFGMPLAQPAGWRKNRYGVFVTGPTGSLKTAWCSTAMCLYGDFRDTSAMLKWGQGFTMNAGLMLASHCHDLVLPIDNYKPSTGEGEQGLISFTHAVFEGTVKLRLNRDSSLRNTPPIHCGVLINGEDYPHSDAATLARFLVVPVQWPAGENNVHLARAQATALHLPAVTRSFIAWLQTDRGWIAAAWAAKQYERLRERWLQAIHAFEKGALNGGRLASNLALNQISLLVASEHPEIGPVLKPYIAHHQAGLATVASEMARGVKELREAARVLAALREMVASGRAQLAPRRGTLNDRPERMLGWKDEQTGDLYLLPGAVRRLAEEYMGRGSLGEISDQKLHKELCDMGLLASHDHARYTIRISAGNNSMVRVLHMRASALCDQDTDEG